MKEILENFYTEYWRFDDQRKLIHYIDGLNKIERRILYVLYITYKNLPKSISKKASTVVGNIIAYHPHGDLFISDIS